MEGFDGGLHPTVVVQSLSQVSESENDCSPKDHGKLHNNDT